MRVLFIYPNQMYTGDKIVFNYGVACLSALLKDNGHDCQLIQCNNCDTDTKIMEKTIKQFQPHLIALSSVSSHMVLTRNIISYLKKFHSSTPVILGGIHATVSPDDAIKIDH